MPFFVVRLTYAFLSVFKSSDLTWNPLVGPVGPFVGMALVMEYVVVWIYLSVGFSIAPLRAECRDDRVDGTPPSQTYALKDGSVAAC